MQTKLLLLLALAGTLGFNQVSFAGDKKEATQERVLVEGTQFTAAEITAIKRYTVESLLYSFDEGKKDGINALSSNVDVLARCILEDKAYKAIPKTGLPASVVKFLEESNKLSVKYIELATKDPKSPDLPRERSELEAFDQKEAKRLGIDSIIAQIMQEVSVPADINKWTAEYQLSHPELQQKSMEEAQAQLEDAFFTEVYIPSLRKYLEKLK